MTDLDLRTYPFDCDDHDDAHDHDAGRTDHTSRTDYTDYTDHTTDHIPPPGTRLLHFPAPGGPPAPIPPQPVAQTLPICASAAPGSPISPSGVSHTPPNGHEPASSQKPQPRQPKDSDNTGDPGRPDPHDLILAARKRQEKPEKDFTFYSVPRYLLENVQHLAVHLKATENETMDVLIRHGLDVMEADPTLQLWMALREAVVGISPGAWRDAGDYGLVRLMMDDLRIGLNPCDRDTARKRNGKLRTTTHDMAGAFAGRVGFGRSTYLVLAVLMMQGQVALLDSGDVFNHGVMEREVQKLIALCQKRMSILAHTLTVADVELSESVLAVIEQCRDASRPILERP